MLRKLCCLALFAVFSLGVSISALAAKTETFDLDDVGMSISLPSDLVVFTRDIGQISSSNETYMKTVVDGASFDGAPPMVSGDRGDPSVYTDSQTGTTFIIPEGWTQEPLEHSGAYLQVRFTPGDASGDIIQFGIYDVWGHMTSIEKIGGLRRQQVNNIMMSNGKIAGMLGVSASQVSKATYNGSEYFIAATKTTTQLVLIDNGYMYSYEFVGPGDSRHFREFEALLNSADYTSIPVSGAASASVPAETLSPAPAASSVFSDNPTGTTFTIPAGFTQKPSEESDGGISVMLEPDDGSIQTISYISKDVWGTMPAENKAGYTKADVDNSVMTVADFAEMFNISETQVSVVTYNGASYFKCVMSTKEVVDTEIDVQVMQLYRFSNGYMFLFQFTGTTGSEHYSDFEALLNSVKYPKAETPPAIAAAPVSPPVSNDGPQAGYTAESFLVSLVLTVVVYSLPIMVYRFCIRKAPAERKAAKRISIIYGIFAFIVMGLIVYALGGSLSGGGAVVLWSYVNYRILVSGLPREEYYSFVPPVVRNQEDPARQPPGANHNPTNASGPEPESKPDETDNDDDDSDASCMGKPLF
jgi:hypothetical protein